MRRYLRSRSLSVLMSMPSADLGGAGGQQLGNARHFHQAKPARAHVINAFQVAERRDFDARFGRGLQDRRALVGADVLAVNR